jgi:hypothetical protein
MQRSANLGNEVVQEKSPELGGSWAATSVFNCSHLSYRFQFKGHLLRKAFLEHHQSLMPRFAHLVTCITWHIPGTQYLLNASCLLLPLSTNGECANSVFVWLVNPLNQLTTTCPVPRNCPIDILQRNDWHTRKECWLCFKYKKDCWPLRTSLPHL